MQCRRRSVEAGWTRRLLPLVLLPILLGCAPEPEPRQLFAQAARAIENLEAVRYTFRFEPDGDPYYEDDMEGEVLIRRLDLSGGAYQARTHARLRPGTGEESRLEVIRTGGDVVLVEHRRETVSTSSLAAFGGRLHGRVGQAMMYAFFDPRSLAGEATAETVTLEGPGEIGGEPCWWVRVAYVDDEEDSRWCLGRSDALPRAMEWISGEGRRSLEIFDLEVFATAADLPADAFVAPEVPDGYALVEAAFGPAAGTPAENWTLPSGRGEAVSLRDQLGHVVILDFFATWCAPCVAGMRGLEGLLAEYDGRPVRAFAVNTMEEAGAAELQAFLDDLGVTYALLMDGDPVHDLYAPGSLPAVVVLDAEGRHVGVANGYHDELTEDHLRRLIDTALAAPTGQAG